MARMRIKRIPGGKNSLVELPNSGLRFFAHYWDSLKYEQQVKLKDITEREAHVANTVLDTAQREYYFQYRSHGTIHQEALSAALRK